MTPSLAAAVSTIKPESHVAKGDSTALAKLLLARPRVRLRYSKRKTRICRNFRWRRRESNPRKVPADQMRSKRGAFLPLTRLEEALQRVSSSCLGTRRG
jgi:hypothetical protein